MMINESPAPKTFSSHLFTEFINQPTSKRSRKQSEGILEEYQSKLPSGRNKEKQQGYNFIDQIIKATDPQVYQDFQDMFMYGVEMEIWRKGRIKPVFIFLDQNLPSLLWISSKTKAFLFDLTYTTITRCDYEVEKQSGVSNYIVLSYFEEQIPILFREDSQKNANRFFELFNNYIGYNRITHTYPPYFSRIMKLYTMEEVKDNVNRKKRVRDILKVSQTIGMTNQNQNRSILRLLCNQKRKQSITDQTELSNIEIADYFRISHCSQTLKQVFQKYSHQKMIIKLDYLKPLMKKKAFYQFLVEQQYESMQFINQIIEQCKDQLSFYDFCSYLQNDKSNHAACPQKMNENLPINQYFCYSSHNTYLTGNQLTSDSKIERYLQDLEGGLKCVQIDVHNDGQRPIITHAINDKSLCKPIDFEQTIMQIAKFCQNHSDHYPIILSIENHAKDENRYKMVNILMKYLQSRLFSINQDDDVGDCKLLSELRGKIIVKTDANIKDILDFRKKAIMTPNSYLKFQLAPSNPIYPSSSYTERLAKFQKFIVQQQKRKAKFQSSTPKILFLPIAEMTKVTGLFKSQTGIENSNSVGYQCTSLTNEKAVKAGQDKIIQYTKRGFLRIYPVATEIASSNYNPVPVLKLGAQIIALNTQTKDDYAWLMMSYFTAGRPFIPARLGFVQKPIHLRTNTPKALKEKTIDIKILSDEKVSIKFYGTDPDMKINQNAHLTFVAKDYLQGFLMFKIEDKFKDCIPLRYIRKGYRVLVAKNEMFRDCGIRIIIHISIKERQG